VGTIKITNFSASASASPKINEDTEKATGMSHYGVEISEVSFKDSNLSVDL